MAWLGNAWNLSTSDNHVTNVAQIFSGSSLAVVCRIGAGVFTPKYITGKKIGVWNLGDQTVVEEMIDLLDIPQSSVQIIQQAPNRQDLIDGKVACATAITYNEYWQILASGVPSSDLIVINPELFGIPHIEDGLYIMTDRLSLPTFQEQLVKFSRALRTGWKGTCIAPILAVETVQRISPKLNKEHQQHMPETVLRVIPANTDQFGLFDLGRYKAKVNRLLSPGKSPHHQNESGHTTFGTSLKS